MNATLTLLTPGLQTFVVDAGRSSSRSLGVPVGGAADRFALAIGNALLGNSVRAPALELCLLGPTLVADAHLACVVWGAPFATATNRRELFAGTTFTLEPGEELRIGGTSRGMRGYLCVQGGIGTPSILQSCSSLAPLTAGATLPCRSGTTTARRADLQPDHSRRLRVLPGPHADWFAFNRLSQLEVSSSSNRMGIRLIGEPFSVPTRELVSEPTCPGTMQVTRDGQCILLGVDGQTIGGYPKIAHVIAADLDRIGQLRPGDVIDFECVDQATASHEWEKRRGLLREWTTRLRLSSGFID